MMNNKGFSLVEMLVAIAIFLLVSVAALGALLAMTAGGQKVESTRAIVDNIGFVVEDIVREGRLAVNHRCGTLGITDTVDGVQLVRPQACVNGDDEFAFNRLVDGVAGEIIQYRIADNTVQKKEGSGAWQDISLGDINVLDLEFIVTEQLDNDQVPHIRIHLRAVVNEDLEEETEYNIQTSVHPRFPRYERPTS